MQINVLITQLVPESIFFYIKLLAKKTYLMQLIRLHGHSWVMLTTVILLWPLLKFHIDHKYQDMDIYTKNVMFLL